MVYIVLKSYLSDLENNEMTKPRKMRQKVPNLSDIARDTGITYANINKLANNRIGGIKFSTADKIIKSLRSRGFDMQLADLIKFHDDIGETKC